MLHPPVEQLELDPRHSEEHREEEQRDRKSTRLNSSHLVISYAVFCLKKKEQRDRPPAPPRRASLSRGGRGQRRQTSRRLDEQLPLHVGVLDLEPGALMCEPRAPELHRFMSCVDLVPELTNQIYNRSTEHRTDELIIIENRAMEIRTSMESVILIFTRLHYMSFFFFFF